MATRTRLTKAQIQGLIKNTLNQEMSALQVGRKKSRRRRNRRRNQLSGGATVMTTVPAAMSVSQGYRPPKIIGGLGTCVIEHSEIVTTFGVANKFNVQGFRVIPSFPPWLVDFAKCFSKYRWLAFKAVWVPSCPSTTQGSIHMAIRYDEVDAAPTSSAQISTMQSYSTGAIWSGAQGATLLSKSADSPCPPGSICSVLDVTRLEKPWYVYRAAASVSATPDLANVVVPASLVIATEGGAGTTPFVAGHVHWVYRIHVIEPTPGLLNL